MAFPLTFPHMISHPLAHTAAPSLASAPGASIDGTVVAAVLAAATLHALWNAIAHATDDQLVGFALIGVGDTACGAVIVAVAGPPPGGAWVFVATSVVLHCLYTLLLLVSYRLGEFSQMYPVARGTSPWAVALVATTVLGQRLPPVQLAGVLVISGGLISLAALGRPRTAPPPRPRTVEANSAGARHGAGPLRSACPLDSSRADSARTDVPGADSTRGCSPHTGAARPAPVRTGAGHALAAVGALARARGLAPVRRPALRPAQKALAAAFGTGLVIASYTIVDGVGVHHAPVAAYAGWIFLLQGPAMPVLAAARYGRTLPARLRGPAAAGITGGVLSVAAYGLVLWAQARGTLAPIAALRETSIVIGAVIGAVFLGERFGPRRAVAAAVVVTGIVLLNVH